MIKTKVFLIFFIYILPFKKKEKLLYSREKKVQNSDEKKKQKPKDYKVNYICTYIQQTEKRKKNTKLHLTIHLLHNVK